jgi:hypothetical protein
VPARRSGTAGRVVAVLAVLATAGTLIYQFFLR